MLYGDYHRLQQECLVKVLEEITVFNFGAIQFFFHEDGSTFSVETTARFYLNTWDNTPEAINLTSYITENHDRVLRIVEAQDGFLSLVTSHFFVIFLSPSGKKLECKHLVNVWRVDLSQITGV